MFHTWPAQPHSPTQQSVQWLAPVDVLTTAAFPEHEHKHRGRHEKTSELIQSLVGYTRSPIHGAAMEKAL